MLCVNSVRRIACEEQREEQLERRSEEKREQRSKEQREQRSEEQRSEVKNSTWRTAYEEQLSDVVGSCPKLSEVVSCLKLSEAVRS